MLRSPKLCLRHNFAYTENVIQFRRCKKGKATMSGNQIFEEGAEEYDKWFEENTFAYESEVLALGTLIPKNSTGLEVGVGTGRFAVPPGYPNWRGTSKSDGGYCKKRGLEVCEAKAEELPFDNESFDFILMTTTMCFLKSYDRTPGINKSY
nr:SAM-dependent methyltransferases [uncultured archaeon GZfos27E7]